MDLFDSFPKNGGKYIKYSKGYFFNSNLYLDIRVNNWPLMKSIVPTIMIGIIYIIAVIFGLKWMKNRKPFQLYYFMMIYNLFQVFICACITCGV
jgi:hypothetical protein